jgi:hypothetical protein
LCNAARFWEYRKAIDIVSGIPKFCCY